MVHVGVGQPIQAGQEANVLMTSSPQSASRPTSRGAAHEVRTGHQHKDREGAWPDHPESLLIRADQVISSVTIH